MTSCVYTEKADGTDRIFLGELAPVRATKWTHGLPGGPLKAFWDFHAPPDFDHRALLPGRKVGIIDGGGARTFKGVLTQVQRGNPWQCSADGNGALGQRYRAFPIPVTGDFYDLNAVLTQATGRGLPWNLPASFPTIPGPGTLTADSAPQMSIADVLNKVTHQNGLTWWVDSFDNLVFGTPLDTPSHLFAPADAAGGRALTEKYVSGVLIAYKSSTTGNASVGFFSDADRTARFGTTEVPVDITGQGAITPAQATTAANAYLALHGPRAPFAGQFTLGVGQLLSAPGGVAVHPSTLVPPVTGRLIFTDPDHAAEVYQQSATDVWVSQTDYDDELETVQVTPWDSDGTGLRWLLSHRDVWN